MPDLQGGNDSGPISLDDAVAALDAAEDAEDAAAEAQEAAPEKPAEAAPEKIPEAAEEPEQKPEGDEADAEEAPAQEEEQAESIDPPRSWNNEDREEFTKLPVEAQKIIARREQERESAISKVHQEGAERRKRAEAEASEFAAYKASLDQLLPLAAESIKRMWGEPNWTQYADTHGPTEAFKAKVEYDRQLGELQRLFDAQKSAAEIEYRKFIAAESEQLKTVAPDLADPKEGVARLQSAAKFLSDHRIDESRYRYYNAQEWALVYDAMRYRAAKTGIAKQLPKPGAKPQPVAAKKPASAIRPGAAPHAASRNSTVAAAWDRFNKTSSVKDALALLDTIGE